MKDAIPITESAVGLSDFKLYTKGALEFEENGESEIVHQILTKDNSYFSISKDNSIFDLMEPDEQAIVMSEFDEFNIFPCLFYDINYLNILISSVPSDRKIIIDNDHGTFMTREHFLNLNSYEEFIRRF